MTQKFKRRLWLSLLLALFSLLAVITHLQAQRAQAAYSPGRDDGSTPKATEASAQLTEANSEGIRLVLEVPTYHVDELGAAASPGLGKALQEAGSPALPYYSTLMVIPPAAEVRVNIEQGQVTRENVAAVRPAPGADIVEAESSISPDTLPHSAPSLTASINEPNAAIYSKDALYPAASYRLSQPMYYRDLRLVRLDLFPLRYNPVRQEMEHAREMQVHVSFTGAQPAQQPQRPVGSDDGAAYGAIAPFIINYEQAQQWRSLPSSFTAEETQLPIGQDVFKIEVDADGIYELTYDALQTAGMAVNSVDPGTFEMLHREQPVAYQFVGDDDANFESGESIRFYGWAFDGPRSEQQYVTNNVFWLWAGGTASRVSDTPSTSEPDTAMSYEASMTHEPEIYYFAGYTDRWDQFPNEPDAWYWDRIDQPKSAAPHWVTETVTVTAPAGNTGSAVVTAEFTSYIDSGYTDVEMFVNGDMSYSQPKAWSGNRNVNISVTVPITVLNDGPNQIQFRFDRSVSRVLVYLNRITVDYQRHFVSDGDQLIFRDTKGPHTYEVSGFNTDEAIAWDISNRYEPKRITDLAVDGNGPYTYTFDTNKADATFIVTHEGNVYVDPAIHKYTPPDLDAAGGADWVAISHGDFIPEVNRLAAHRSDPRYGGLTTHVVDVEDVYNQYGYGLPLPGAIRNYMRHALQDWTLAPRYLLLVGDATLDPRQICTSNDKLYCLWGKTTEPTYVVTDLLFADRLQGHIAVDYTFGLLTGDDLIPELAVGRIAAQSGSEVRNAVDKTMTYETLHLAPTDWQKNILFLADNDDNGGAFCDANQQVGTHIPDSFVQNHICLADDPNNPTGPPRQEDVDAMVLEMYEAINNDGATLVNYRGHGAVQEWAHELASTATPGKWLNVGRPVTILSMDCLDGAFAFPNMTGLAETLLSLNDVGTVAHWSSTGLGWDFEHDVLHYGFYDGLFQQGLTAIGDAVDYSKIAYEQTVFHDSQLLSFALQGDPAMQLMRPSLSIVKSTSQTVVKRGDTIEYQLALRNDGLHAAPTTVVDTLPTAVDFINATTSVPGTISVHDNVVTIKLDSLFAWNDTAIVDLEVTVSETYQGNALTNVARVSSPGLDLDPSDNESQVTSVAFSGNLFLPVLRKE